MRPTPKHLRPRWRYLGIGLETWPDASIEREAFQRACWRSCRALAGDVGGADADLTVYSFDCTGGRGEAVVRTPRGSVPLARAAICAIDSIDDQPVRPRVRGVSGTVRGCEEKYLGRDQEPEAETSVTVDGVDRTGHRRGARIDIRSETTYVGATTLDFE